MNLKFAAYVIATAGVLSAFAAQTDLGAVGTYVQNLNKNQSLIATVRAVKAGGQPVNYTLSYSVDGKFRIENETQLIISDGKQVWTLNKAANTYTVAKADLAATKVDALAEFAGFFDKKMFSDATQVQDSGAKTISDTQTENYEITFKDGKTINLFIDGSTNLAKGEEVKDKGSRLIAIVKTAKASDQALPDSTFSFTAPDGAKEVKAPAPGSIDYSTVNAIFQSNCMPCHSADSASGGLDLSSYASMMKDQVVTAGDAANSELYQLISGPNPKMPRNRSPLSAADQQTIHDWIQAGAKGPQSGS